MRQDLKRRTKVFALDIIRLCSGLPSKPEARVLGNQLLRSGTSVGARYREAQRAKSNADFISKIEGGLQELEETEYWLELLEESGLVEAKTVQLLKKEVNELIAMFVSMARNTKAIGVSRK